MKYIFAGDRDLAVWVLSHLINSGYYPEMLLLTEFDKGSHCKELIEISKLSMSLIFFGNSINSESCKEKLREIKPDYIIGIHFPYLISKDLLAIPKIGFVNLHPAFLPFNRGWHTPTWAILDGNPIGATIHFMSEELDAGDIILQKQIELLPEDTADKLYKRLKLLEFEVFKEALPSLISEQFSLLKQNLSIGTAHRKIDLVRSDLRFLDLSSHYLFEDLLLRMRAFTTSDFRESVYFYIGKKKYYLQVKITSESEE